MFPTTTCGMPVIFCLDYYSSLIFNWSPLLLSLTPKSFINTDCENGPFTFKLVHVIPLLKTYLYHSEKPIIFQWHTRSSAISTATSPASHTYTHLSDVISYHFSFTQFWHIGLPTKP